VLIAPTYNFYVSLDDAGRQHVTARVLNALRNRITSPPAWTQPRCCFEARLSHKSEPADRRKSPSHTDAF
jgi:hypothetical protein